MMASTKEILIQKEISRSIIGIICGFLSMKIFLGALKLCAKLAIAFVVVYAMLWSLDLHEIMSNVHKTCPRMRFDLDLQSSVIGIIVDRIMLEVDLKSSYWNSLFSDAHILTGTLFGMALGFLF
mmetsp:Transcript_9868/g.18561  ORF Transcript_9868/g.18561 Transcript_9868/m.18561 type:complete len:124 (+) Transcript_9868:183-554(+)